VLGSDVLELHLQLRPGFLEDQHVFGVESAVAEPGAVERRQRLDDAPEQRQEVVQVTAATLTDELRERLSLDELLRDADQLAIGSESACHDICC
jgi:hypothetical protein